MNRKFFKENGSSFNHPLHPTILSGSTSIAAQEIDTAAKDLHKLPQNERPQAKEFLTIKEVAQMLRVSEWTIYQLIKNDRTFPFLNIGVKKKFVVSSAKLQAWSEKRTMNLFMNERNLPTGEALMKTKGAKYA